MGAGPRCRMQVFSAVRLLRELELQRARESMATAHRHHEAARTALDEARGRSRLDEEAARLGLAAGLTAPVHATWLRHLVRSRVAVDQQQAQCSDAGAALASATLHAAACQTRADGLGHAFDAFRRACDRDGARRLAAEHDAQWLLVHGRAQ